jgi:hypothetical protein
MRQTPKTAGYPKTFAYDFVTGAERGIPADYWRRTATTGYFDAMPRPVSSNSDIGAYVQVNTLLARVG